MVMSKTTRAPKQLGDFGEALATYALIRAGFEVANVDHVGADLIAEKNDVRYAISVKTRLFRHGSKESRMMPVEKSHLKKLEHFATQFGMTGIFAQIVCLADDQTIHMFMMKSQCIPKILGKTKTGYSILFGNNRIKHLIDHPLVDYCRWENEMIGTSDFLTRDCTGGATK